VPEIPELLDVKRVVAETGMSRAAADKVMRALPIVRLPGLRKVYVRRSDLAEYIEAHTYASDQVPAN
jgi:hypothetical protein